MTVMIEAREAEVRDAVRAIVAEEIAPRAAEVDATSAFPHEGCLALARAGLGGLLVPPEHGGSGDSSVSYVLAIEEIAAACGSTSTVYMTNAHCAYPVLLAGTDEQHARVLPGLCDGSAYGAIAVTEPEAGSDVASLRTTARRDGDAYVLDGAKTFITTGDRADHLVVFATVDRAAGRDGITAFLVAHGTPGFEAGRVLGKLGMHGSSTAELFFDGCRIPADARLGEEGGGWALSMRSVVKSRLSAAAQGVGLARGAWEAGRAWAADHDLLRGSSGFAQEAQFALAELHARIAAARALLHETARLVDASDDDPIAEVSAAKLHCTDAGMHVASEVVGLLGEDGDLPETGAERFLRDVKVTQIYDGTNQVQRLLVARALVA